ncbi:penicillin-binding protein 2 [Rhodovastum atsumiense]|uniref:Penicillin-binding protein 2 n=1 Tax=Rhodovastum atsumiense TaxID=504468 RepID=A0A5M6IXQ5_9PROT|nr:penicillin-binding protein 2 [Rhodovastum atsumiense]KAA5613072.1 penicillin-binding protein 2 [Rhodovastum atsumiense]
MRREAQRTGVFTRRALLVATGQVGVLGLLGAKLYQVQVVEGARYATLAESNRISARLVAAPRGRVLDRFGVVAAGNELNWRALLVAEQTEDVSATLDNFSRIVPLADHERARIEREMRRHRRFVPISVREFLSWEEMARIEVNAPDLPGILVDVGTTRMYPFGPTLAHVIGYVAPPNENDVADDPMLSLPGLRIGRAGIEKWHDKPLRGRAGAVQLEVNAVGRVIRELDRQEGVKGQDIGLSIDTELQKAVLERLGDESASAVVMDCRTGEVLAMATNPSFDPTLFNSGVSQAQWAEWTRNRRAPLINKAVAGLYAPGSTFKMVVALAGLEAKVISPTDRINCPGHLDLGDTRFHCWRKGGHGLLDVRSAIKHSCDVFFYEVARRVGIDRIAAMANRFGLGVKLPIELPGARQGLVPTRAWRIGQGHPWNLGDTIVHGIGQGFLQLTPLSLAVMTSRIATGRAVQPHLTRSIGGVLQAGARPEDWPLLGIADRDLGIVRDGMWQVVNDGGGTATVARLAIPGVQLAGKTGSTQVRRVSREQREKGFKSETLAWEFRPHALFVAYAPYDAPRYAMAIVVEHGNAGAAAAAPVARDIMTVALTRDPLGRRDPSQRMADMPPKEPGR